MQQVRGRHSLEKLLARRLRTIRHIVLGCFCTVVPPTRIPQALKQLRPMTINEMNIAANDFIEEFEVTKT